MSGKPRAELYRRTVEIVLEKRLPSVDVGELTTTIIDTAKQSPDYESNEFRAIVGTALATQIQFARGFSYSTLNIAMIYSVSEDVIPDDIE